MQVQIQLCNCAKIGIGFLLFFLGISSTWTAQISSQPVKGILAPVLHLGCPPEDFLVFWWQLGSEGLNVSIQFNNCLVMKIHY